MSEELEKNLAKRIEHDINANEKRNISKKDGFDKNKVIDDVLDKTTIMTLSKMINSGIISYVNGGVGSGKESKTYWAVNSAGKDVALKIYLVSASNFKKRTQYIQGDPRFTRLKKGTRNMVELWAQKEFRNLNQCINNNILVPKPLGVLKNVLAMEFIGKDGIPAQNLVETEVDSNNYEKVISIITNLYKKAKLVHGDFSEYNIFKTDDEVVLFDLGSAVDIRHQNAKSLLERDIKNISRFFVKRGLTVENPSDIFERITK